MVRTRHYSMELCGPDGDWTFNRQIPTLNTDMQARQVAELMLCRRPEGTALSMGMVTDSGDYTYFLWEVSRGEIALMRSESQ